MSDVIGVMAGWQCVETLRQEAEQRLAQVTSQADQEVRPGRRLPETRTPKKGWRPVRL